MAAWAEGPLPHVEVEEGAVLLTGHCHPHLWVPGPGVDPAGDPPGGREQSAQMLVEAGVVAAGSGQPVEVVARLLALQSAPCGELLVDGRQVVGPRTQEDPHAAGAPCQALLGCMAQQVAGAPGCPPWVAAPAAAGPARAHLGAVLAEVAAQSWGAGVEEVPTGQSAGLTRPPQ